MRRRFKGEWVKFFFHPAGAGVNLFVVIRVYFYILTAFSPLLWSAQAAPQFAPVLQDHMVIQRDEPVTLWGTAREGETVSVEWKGRRAQSKVTRGRWVVQLPPLPADAEGSVITATDSTGSATLNDVLVGDVWLASGQSNMEWTIAKSAPAPPAIKVENPQVRILHGFGPLQAVNAPYTEELYRNSKNGKGYQWNWRVCSAETIRDFSAVATFFALRLQEHIRVPVGIIGNAKGGTGVETWLPRELINKKAIYASVRGDLWLHSPDVYNWNKSEARRHLKHMIDRGEKNLHHPFAPAYHYEAAVMPLKNLNIKGVIWYQGESNAFTPEVELNAAKQKDLVTSWRSLFRKHNLPFIMVQLPRINAPGYKYWPNFREAQARCARETHGVELICTIDLGAENGEIHPKEKVPVGHRLADMARSAVYGERGLPTYPKVKNWRAVGNKITITFDQELKTTDGKAPWGFVVGEPARPDSFTAVNAALNGNTVTFTLPTAWQSKMAWRYVNTAAATPNLVGATGGLPAFPARSDTKKSVN